MSSKNRPSIGETLLKYFTDLKVRYAQADYTEGTFRTPIENFLKSLNAECEFNQEPDRATKLGAPDFKVYRRGVKIGYIETKELEDDLDKELESEQITKYKGSINNIILTNYTRFILIRNDECIFDFNLFDIADLKKGTLHNAENKMEKFLKMNDAFVSYHASTILTQEELANALSKKAKMLRELAETQLLSDSENKDQQQSSLFDFYTGIKELINEISIHDCADAYAQTVTYGLFLARMNSKAKLSREIASTAVSQKVGIIKKIFVNVSADLPPNLTWIIDEIIDVLNASDMEKILTEIDERGKTDRTPFTHFYEEFLQAYDPARRKGFGQYNTPRPAVSFIANAVNTILKIDFKRLNGFADDDVTVLDPATGTGTFLWIVYLVTLGELKGRGLSGLISSKITNHLLRDFYGFEIQITPYIFAHLKLSDILRRWFYTFKQSDRIPVYLTNTLEPSESHGLIPFMRELGEESEAANAVKQQKKILAILGNPPYSGESYNKKEWITTLMKVGYCAKDGRTDEGYYKVKGEPLGEKNPKWIGNDYVKFIRFAQWKIDMGGEGVVGYITDNSYLDNPTFRGVRWSLMGSFNKIYILNLHGHAIKDRNPTAIGGKDENVFPIKQGVAIALLVKNGESKSRTIKYADLWGTRDFKFSWLDRNSLNTIKWRDVSPRPPMYSFVPTNSEIDTDYASAPSIPEIFPVNSVGIVTARDDLTIRWTPEDVLHTVTTFTKLDEEDARTRFKLGKDSLEWNVRDAQADVKESNPAIDHIVPILYRPFDTRYTFYTGKSKGFQCRPRPEVMNHMKQPNISLLFHKREELPVPYGHFLVTDKMAEHSAISIKTICYQAPLYLYKNGNRTSNVSFELIDSLSEKYGKEVTAEEVFNYVYAVGYSSKYRKKYNEVLRQDFPRIPFTNFAQNFKVLTELGKTLIDLHLGKLRLNYQSRFDIPGTNRVEKVIYSNGKIEINSGQHFDNVQSMIWNFRVGGYLVLEKWLKSRKGQVLAGKDIEDFLNLIEIIRETIVLMIKIDKVQILT